MKGGLENRSQFFTMAAQSRELEQTFLCDLLFPLHCLKELSQLCNDLKLCHGITVSHQVKPYGSFLQQFFAKRTSTCWPRLTLELATVAPRDGPASQLLQRMKSSDWRGSWDKILSKGISLTFSSSALTYPVFQNMEENTKALQDISLLLTSWFSKRKQASFELGSENLLS